MTLTSLNTMKQVSSTDASVIPFNRFSAEKTHFDLSSSLQTTLDIDQMFDMFQTKLSEVLSWDSLHYINNDYKIDKQFGKRGRHRIYYHLSIEGKHYGDIYCTKRHQFNSDEIETFENLLSKLVYPLRNALKYQEALQAALKDPLTGVGNRTALEQVMSHELSLAQRHNTPCSMMIIDIDHFKQVNDTYGHDAGDQVLKAVAQQLQDCIRGSDMLFRFGGEEFCVILSNTDMQGAVHLADRTRQAVSDMTCQCDDQMIKVTISIGISMASSGDCKADLFARADKALYFAKDSGRNQVQAI